MVAPFTDLREGDAENLKYLVLSGKTFCQHFNKHRQHERKELSAYDKSRQFYRLGYRKL
jgi:hypothetical protein